jgi:hypothetical protein
MNCLIHSIGSNGDCQWEDAVFERLEGACEIHIFDMDDYDLGEKNTERNMFYHKWGVVSSYDDSTANAIVKRLFKNITTHSFPDIQKLLGHQHRPIDIFKIDCEGCEWYVLCACLRSTWSLMRAQLDCIPHTTLLALCLHSTGPRTRIG